MPSARGDEEVGEMGPKARAPKAVETMTEYEMEREARLAKNREVLQRLGVPEIVAATRIAGADDGDDDDDDEARRRRERERKRKARARDAGGGVPARRSTRASTVATRTGRFYVGKGEAGDDDDDSFDGSEDEEDADGSTEDDDDDDDDDDAVEPVVAVKAKATRRKPARNPERPATAASLYRLPNPATLGRLAPYATDGAMNANFRRPSAFALPAAVNPKPLTRNPKPSSRVPRASRCVVPRSMMR